MEGGRVLAHVCPGDDILPGARGQGRVAMFQIDLRELQIHLGVAGGFVCGIDEALGFVSVIGAQAFALFCVRVEAIVGVANAAKNQAIALHNV